MTTKTETEGRDEAQKIWAELDALDAGEPASVQPPVKVEQGSEAASPDKKEGNPDQAPSQAPAESADATNAEEPDDRRLLLDKINGLEAQVQQLLPLAQRVRNVEGHVGGINSKLQAMRSARETTEAAGHAAPSASELRAAQASPEGMDRLKQDYPEFGTAMEAALDERFGQLTRQLDEIRARSSVPGQLTEAHLDSLRADIQVEISHPGWKETVKQPEFAGWLRRQQREVQLLAESDSPQDAIRLLDLHGESRKAASRESTQRRLESAAAIPSGRSAASTRAKPVEEMTAEEYWRYLDQLDVQKAG